MRLIRRLFTVLVAAALLASLSVAGGYLYLEPKLPSIDSLRDVRLQVPLSVHASAGGLIAEFGEKRRDPVRLDEVPEQMVQAFLAAEDDRFFEHPGVDYQGLLRAAIELVRTGEKRQGGSTITMQVARNFFLSREKTYLRKLNEILLALKIERELSKQEVLELYLNKIYLGNRAYGVGAAAEIYYGVPVNELGLVQVAMIAGLPKAPSRYNPIADPERALARRDYVLRRMRDLRFIDESTYQAALDTPDDARLHALRIQVEAPYVAEMVRAHMVALHGDRAYTDGYQVVTTLDARLQSVANQSLRRALLAYDRRHGYRGAEGTVALPQDLSDSEALEVLLEDYPPIGGTGAAVVLGAGEQSARLFVAGGAGIVEILLKGVKWASVYHSADRQGPAPKTVSEVLSPGDVVRVQESDGIWQLAQIPEVAGAFVAVHPDDGAIRALVGGFDFYESKFNRVTQARRQPGSGFKPVIYSASLEAGFTPASLINDAPVVFDDSGLEAAWRPENYSGRSFGPTRMRVALMKSRNLVSIRLLRAIGIEQAVAYAERFGFDTRRLPRNLSLALGTAVFSPLEMARAYSVLANGGFRTTPYFVERILDDRDEVVFQAEPEVACRECEQDVAFALDSSPPGEVADAEGIGAPGSEPLPEDAAERSAPVAQRVISPQIHYLMNSMLKDVVRHGTARKARALERSDIAGKTGTTNDQRDAWFNGFSADLVAVAWVGFDDSETLGNRETGGRAALPMWMSFMKQALDGVPEKELEEPPGLVTVRIDAESGLLAGAGRDGTVFETFREENVPERRVAASVTPTTREDNLPADDVTDQLF